MGKSTINWASFSLIFTLANFHKNDLWAMFDLWEAGWVSTALGPKKTRGSPQRVQPRLLADLAKLGVLAQSDEAILSDGCLRGEVRRRQRRMEIGEIGGDF